MNIEEFNEQHAPMWHLGLAKDKKSFFLRNNYTRARLSNLGIGDKPLIILLETLQHDYIAKYRAVMIVKDKYSTRYLEASTGKTINKHSLKLLTDRNDAGWYPEPKEPTSIGITELDIPTLPAILQDEAKRRLAVYNTQLLKYKQSLSEWQDIQKAISEKNGLLAWQCLYNRSSYEYEEVCIKELEL
jgi:hypothetical protein